MRCEGVLAPHSRVLGPGSRGGLDYALRGVDGAVPVYVAGAETVMSTFAGREVVVWGRLVRVDGAQELWPGRISEM